MGVNGGIRQQLLAASLGVSLLQPIALSAVGSVLLGADWEVRAQQALSTEAIGRIAQAITVRIEGATQGSGVLVKREGNHYTVLTAWHVVSGQKPGEEMAVYTPDGLSHEVNALSIRRVDQTDLALLSFTANANYATANPGTTTVAQIGAQVFVSGFPLPSSAVQTRVFRFLSGLIISNVNPASKEGYELLYSSPTLPGMSGGAVLNSEGQLIGIHGRAETDAQLTEQEGIAVKTGSNQGMPIELYFQSIRKAFRQAPSHNTPMSVQTTQALPSSSNKPAAKQLLTELVLTAAVNSCELAVEEKLPVEKSVIASSKAISFLVTNRYGSKVAGLGKLGAEQIFNESIGYIVARVKAGCYDRLNTTDKSFVVGVQNETEQRSSLLQLPNFSRSNKPAPMELMNDLAITAAVNSCELAVAEKLPVEKAVIASAKAITFLVTNRYGSQVAGAGKLSFERIANGSIIQIVARVKQGCYDRLTAADKKFVDGVLSEVEKAAKSQPQQQPRR
ncbi:MAG: serine protease [Cyanobacteriota bacterium]